MKNQNIINYSPSEFAFGFEACNSCYYDKKINGIELKVRFPGIFSKFDSLQKKFYHGKSSKLLSDKLEDGEIIGNFNKRLQNLVTFASSSGASTSSKTHIGAGFVKKTANINDRAVKACSPPDNKVID